MGNISAGFSLLRAGWVLAREGVISAIPSEVMNGPAKAVHVLAGLIARRQSLEKKQSERLSDALNTLGPSWVKLGQFLATRPDVLAARSLLIWNCCKIR